VKTDLDTLLTALYVFCDDHVIGRRRNGRPPLLSDAELLCLAIAQVLLDFPRERHWIRYARKHLRHLFPYIPGQSGYGKRLRAAGPLIAKVIRKLAEVTETSTPILMLIDSTPVPCGMSRETVKRSDLAGDAGYGYCASHSRYFWGMRLYLVTTVEGMPVTWCLAHPKLDEREVMAALFEVDHHLVQAGQVILADKGFAGADFETFLDGLGVHLVRPARNGVKRDPEPSPAQKRLLRMRQWIEAIFDTLKGQLSLEQHGARQRHGLYAPRGPASPGDGRLHLAQHQHRRPQQTITHRVRPLSSPDFGLIHLGPAPWPRHCRPALLPCRVAAVPRGCRAALLPCRVAAVPRGCRPAWLPCRVAAGPRGDDRCGALSG
jgi:Transposase DDE domain